MTKSNYAQRVVTDASSAPKLKKFLSDVEVPAEYPFTTATLRRWRLEGKGPNYLKVGSRVVYSRSAIEAFLTACEVKTKNEAEN